MSVRSYEPLERKLVYNCCFKNVKSIFLLLFLFISSCKPLQHNIYILHWTSKKMSQWWIKYLQHIFMHHSTVTVTTVTASILLCLVWTNFKCPPVWILDTWPQVFQVPCPLDTELECHYLLDILCPFLLQPFMSS